MIKYPEVEGCYCPTPHTRAWKDAYGCRASAQIEADFAKFPPRSITRESLDAALRVLQVPSHGGRAARSLRRTLTHCGTHGATTGG